MITLKRVDQNFIGACQLLSKFKYFIFLIFFNISLSQALDYEEYLNFLPDSVRSSVEARITDDIEDASRYDELNELNQVTDQEIKNNTVPSQKNNFLGIQDPKLFGYDLFDNQNLFYLKD